MLYLLTGNMQSGKTTWLRALIAEADRADVTLDGLITPAVFEGGEKTGIDLLLLPQQTTLHLAVRSDIADAEGTQLPTTGMHMHWVFDDAVMEKANEHLAQITPAHPSTRMLLIDELGWLELNEGGGYTEALRILDEECFKNAIVVTRPQLLEKALDRWAKQEPTIITPAADYSSFLDR